MKEVKLVDSINHSEIRNILLKHGTRWRQSKMMLDGRDPQLGIKKSRLNG